MKPSETTRAHLIEWATQERDDSEKEKGLQERDDSEHVMGLPELFKTVRDGSARTVQINNSNYTNCSNYAYAHRAFACIHHPTTNAFVWKRIVTAQAPPFRESEFCSFCSFRILQLPYPSEAVEYSCRIRIITHRRRGSAFFFPRDFVCRKGAPRDFLSRTRSDASTMRRRAH